MFNLYLTSGNAAKLSSKAAVSYKKHQQCTKVPICPHPHQYCFCLSVINKSQTNKVAFHCGFYINSLQLMMLSRFISLKEKNAQLATKKLTNTVWKKLSFSYLTNHIQKSNEERMSIINYIFQIQIILLKIKRKTNTTHYFSLWTQALAVTICLFLPKAEQMDKLFSRSTKCTKSEKQVFKTYCSVFQETLCICYFLEVILFTINLSQLF